MRGEERTGRRMTSCCPGGAQRSPGDTPGPPMARNPPGRRRRLGGKPPGPIARPARAAASALTALIMTVLAWFPAPGQALAAHAAARVAHPTVVTLTFDDGTADQLAAARVLHSYGMAGTFFIITGAAGAPHYMSLAELRQLAAAGDEIGGHTVSHLDLVNTTLAEARRQICAGRNILTRWGFHVTSFAYPDGAANRQIEAIVAACGFSAARVVSGLAGPDCPGCAAAESLPPADRYAIRSHGQVESSATLAGLERSVLTAQRHGGGWVPLIFHHVCPADNCGELSIRDATFRAFVAWLAQQRSHGIVVETMHQAIGGQVRPTVPVPAARPHGVVNPSLDRAGPSAVTNPSMETPDGSGAPSCWMEGGYGQNSARWQRIRQTDTGRWAERLTVTHYRSGGAEFLQLFDLGECALPVRAGRSYELSASYRGTVTTQFSVYYRNAAGRWQYWTSSPYFSPSGQWARADWRTPPVPAGITGLSFGLSAFANGTLITDAYRFGPAPARTAQVTAARLALLAVLLAIAAAIVRWLIRRRRTARLAVPAVSAAPAGRQARDRSARSLSSSR
jgi:peptidoglycan/xylan/chitin deacetylase (PgdA/CDA1 family)